MTKWANWNRNGTEKGGDIYPLLTKRSNSNIGVSIFARPEARFTFSYRARRGSVIEHDNARRCVYQFSNLSLFLSFFFAPFSPAAPVPKIRHTYPIRNRRRGGGEDGCARYERESMNS